MCEAGGGLLITRSVSQILASRKDKRCMRTSKDYFNMFHCHHPSLANYRIKGYCFWFKERHEKN